jgi:uncharacterized membrane protein
MSATQDIMGALGRLTRLDWAYVHFKAALGLLWFIPLTQVEYLQRQTAVWFIIAWGAVTCSGFIISLVGLIMSAQSFETRRNGFRVEMAGLCLIMAAPAVYGAIQIGLMLNGGENRWLALAFAYILCSALVPRIVMIKQAAKSRTVIYRYLEKVEPPGSADPTESVDDV